MVRATMLVCALGAVTACGGGDTGDVSDPDGGSCSASVTLSQADAVVGGPAVTLSVVPAAPCGDLKGNLRLYLTDEQRGDDGDVLVAGAAGPVDAYHQVEPWTWTGSALGDGRTAFEIPYTCVAPGVVTIRPQVLFASSAQEFPVQPAELALTCTAPGGTTGTISEPVLVPLCPSDPSAGLYLMGTGCDDAGGCSTAATENASWGSNVYYVTVAGTCVEINVTAPGQSDECTCDQTGCVANDGGTLLAGDQPVTSALDLEAIPFSPLYFSASHRAAADPENPGEVVVVVETWGTLDVVRSAAGEPAFEVTGASGSSLSDLIVQNGSVYLLMLPGELARFDLDAATAQGSFEEVLLTTAGQADIASVGSSVFGVGFENGGTDLVITEFTPASGLGGSPQSWVVPRASAPADVAIAGSGSLLMLAIEESDGAAELCVFEGGALDCPHRVPHFEVSDCASAGGNRVQCVGYDALGVATALFFEP